MTSPIYSRLHLFRRGAGAPPPDPDDAPSSPPAHDGPPSGRNRVKRALFGPVDHEENIRFVHMELAKGRREASERWNYDFENDRPIEGRYEWQQSNALLGASALTAINSDQVIISRTESNVDCDKKDVSAAPSQALKSGSSATSGAESSSSGPESGSASGHEAAPTTTSRVGAISGGESSSSGPESGCASGHEAAAASASAASRVGLATSDAKSFSSGLESGASRGGSTSGAMSSASGGTSSTAKAASATSQRQMSIKDHFTHRKKRSRSKVKVQERKKSSEVDENQVST